MARDRQSLITVSAPPPPAPPTSVLLCCSHIHISSILHHQLSNLCIADFVAKPGIAIDTLGYHILHSPHIGQRDNSTAAAAESHPLSLIMDEEEKDVVIAQKSVQTRTTRAQPEPHSLSHILLSALTSFTRPCMCSPSAPSTPTSSSLPLTLTLTSVSPVTRLLEKRKQLLSVQHSLDSQKVDYQQKETQFKRREENLRKKDLELQEALVLFNRFLKENEMKRRRAEQRANEEIKKRQQWEREIEKRQKVLEALMRKCERLKRNVKKNEKYQSYLQMVYDDHSQPFDELQSIMARYSTLHAANTDLIAAQQQSSTALESARQAYSSSRKDKHTALLQLTNEVAVWSAEYERVERSRREVEEGMEVEEQRHEGRQREIIQCILGTDNLYARCKRELQGIRRHGEAAAVDGKVAAGGGDGFVGLSGGWEGATMARVEREVAGKLAEIGEYVVDLQDIVESVGGLSMDPSKSRTHSAARREREKDKEEAKEVTHR